MQISSFDLYSEFLHVHFVPLSIKLKLTIPRIYVTTLSNAVYINRCQAIKILSFTLTFTSQKLTKITIMSYTQLCIVCISSNGHIFQCWYELFYVYSMLQFLITSSPFHWGTGPSSSFYSAVLLWWKAWFLLVKYYRCTMK